MTASVSESAVSFESVRVELKTKTDLRLVVPVSASRRDSETESSSRVPNADRVSAWLNARGQKHVEASWAQVDFHE